MFKTIYYAGKFNGDNQQRVSTEDSKDAAFWSEFDNNEYLRVGVVELDEVGGRLPETAISLEIGKIKTFFEEEILLWVGTLEELKDLLKKATQEDSLID